MSLTKPTLSNLRAAGTTVGDIYFPQTTLLLPFDGSNGATTTSDLSDSNQSVTFNNSAVISTAQSKFGGSSFYSASNGDIAQITNKSITNHLHTASNFTVEFWHKSTESGTPSGFFFDTTWTSTNYGMWMGYYSGEWRFAVCKASSGNYVVRTEISATWSNPTDWHHFALVRNGTTYTYYVDGSSVATGTSAGGEGTISNDSGYSFGLGGVLDNTAYSLNGYYDDLRISHLARYTGNFTPPTTAHLTSAGDINKQIIINSAADGVAVGTGGINQSRIVKAWCNFDGDGTVSIRGSYNVSSVTDNGTGDYTVNFSTAMSDTNFAASITSADIDDNGSRVGQSVPFIGSGNSSGAYGDKGVTTSSCRIHICYVVSNSGLTLEDIDYVHALFFGN